MPVQKEGWHQGKENAPTLAFCIMRSWGSTLTASTYTHSAHRIWRAAKAHTHGILTTLGHHQIQRMLGTGAEVAELASSLQATRASTIKHVLNTLPIISVQGLAACTITPQSA